MGKLKKKSAALENISKIHRSQEENPYEPLLEIEWTLIIHNNCIFPYYMNIVSK
jgi:hypothetical protein